MSFEQTIREIIREEVRAAFKELHGLKEQPRFLSVPEAAKVLRIGVTSTYELCHQSEFNNFPCIRAHGDSGKILIPYQALMKWIDDQTKNDAI